MKLNEKDLTLKTNKETLQYLLQYVNLCKITAFGYIPNQMRVNELEQLLLYSLNSLCEKLGNHLYKNLHEPLKKDIRFKINKAERVTLSVMFQRVGIQPVLSEIEYLIINKLKLEI